MVKKMTIDGTKLNLQIWDTAGQERFRRQGYAQNPFKKLKMTSIVVHSMAPMYYRGAAAAILVPYPRSRSTAFMLRPNSPQRPSPALASAATPLRHAPPPHPTPGISPAELLRV